MILDCQSIVSFIVNFSSFGSQLGSTDLTQLSSSALAREYCWHVDSHAGAGTDHVCLHMHVWCSQSSTSCALQFKLAPRDTRSLDRQAAKAAPATAGKQWFDLPAQQMTDETKRDLKLLQLRGTFDPKRFYKSSDHKKGLPKFFQVGTVVESSADFYSGVVSARTMSLHTLRWRMCNQTFLSDYHL